MTTNLSTTRSRRRTLTRRRITTWCVVALAAVSVACGHSEQPASTPAQPGDGLERYSAPAGIDDPTAPQAQLTRVLSTLYSWEPVTDASPTDALHRATNDLTEQAAASARTPSAGIGATAEWGAWRTAGDLISARVTDAQATELDPNHAIGHATVIQTVLHVDGGATPYRRFTATARLTREHDGWKVATYPTAE